MPVQLLPASAAAFAPRASSVNVVLGSKVEPWLTQTLKRIIRVKRPLNSVPQHQRCLTETLSSPNAIWTLASLMLPKAPKMRQDDSPLVEALLDSQLVHLEAYIVHVDMVLRNEVAYKLTSDTIESLGEYHKEVHCVDVDAKAKIYDWSGKDQQCKKLHEDFVRAINKFVFRTHVTALEGLEEEGSGELLGGKADEVKNNVLCLMRPLLPPPPTVVDVIRQPPLLPSSPSRIGMRSQATSPQSMPAVDAWRIVPSSPSMGSASQDSSPTSIWANMAYTDFQLPSPAAYSQPFSSAGFLYSSPVATTPIPSLPLPRMFAPQCGIGMDYGGFGWDKYQGREISSMGSISQDSPPTPIWANMVYTEPSPSAAYTQSLPFTGFFSSFPMAIAQIPPMPLPSTFCSTVTQAELANSKDEKGNGLEINAAQQ